MKSFLDNQGLAYRVQRLVELCSHQHDGHDLVQSAQTTSIRLDVVQRLRLQELLEHDTILAMLAGGDFDVVLAQGSADSGVAEDVVRGGRFLDEERFEGGEVSEILLSFGDGPDLR